MNASPPTRKLFRHVTVDKAALYRAIMDVFAAAKRQFRPYLRPDEVLCEAAWPNEPPVLEEVRTALAQLVDWGNLESQPDTAQVRCRRLSHGNRRTLRSRPQPGRRVRGGGLGSRFGPSDAHRRPSHRRGGCCGDPDPRP